MEGFPGPLGTAVSKDLFCQSRIHAPLPRNDKQEVQRLLPALRRQRADHGLLCLGQQNQQAILTAEAAKGFASLRPDRFDHSGAGAIQADDLTPAQVS